MIIQNTQVDIETPTGIMRCYEYRPVELGKYPGIVFYSEIFQQTAPIARSAAILAGFGFVVLVPEVFHELNPIGTVLGYDDAGKDKGNQDKWEKPLEHHDSDTQTMFEFFQTKEYCTGIVGVMGVCIGGHLAYRAVINPNIKSAFCLYATDIHSDTLPAAENNDSFSRTKAIKGELFMVFGKQDPHVPQEGREKIYHNLVKNNINYNWLEVNAQHAFMRDEGERYDPQLALKMYYTATEFFTRTLSH